MNITKKKVFWSSLGGVLLGFLITGTTMLTFWCGEGNYACWNKFEFPGHALLIFLPVFLFSVGTYFLREEVFRAWLRFAYWWIPLSLVMIYLAAGSGGGGWGIPNIYDQETFAVIFSGLFALISLILIAIKSLLLRRK